MSISLMSHTPIPKIQFSANNSNVYQEEAVPDLGNPEAKTEVAQKTDSPENKRPHGSMLKSLGLFGTFVTGVALLSTPYIWLISQFNQDSASGHDAISEWVVDESINDYSDLNTEALSAIDLREMDEYFEFMMSSIQNKEYNYETSTLRNDLDFTALEKQYDQHRKGVAELLSNYRQEGKMPSMGVMAEDIAKIITADLDPSEAAEITHSLKDLASGIDTLYLDGDEIAAAMIFLLLGTMMTGIPVALFHARNKDAINELLLVKRYKNLDVPGKIDTVKQTPGKLADSVKQAPGKMIDKVSERFQD